MSGTLEILQGDLTRETTDAIVNAANESLQAGGGVCGAIFRAAGQPDLQRECDQIGHCPTGEARITKGYRLPSKWIIHTVGPVWSGGNHNEKELLASCYRNSLKLAFEKNLRSISFPSISTGIYGFPVDLAAPIAIHEIRQFLNDHPLPERVRIVCFDSDTYRIYESRLN